MQRKNLSEILSASSRTQLAQAWETTAAARDTAPLPRGEYLARVVEGKLGHAQTGTPGYQLTFEVLEGDYKGRRIWHDLWLTEAALPLTKRDLGKLGITSLDQLDKPLVPGIRCRVQVVLRQDDDGTRRNRVRHFEVIGIDTPERDPFAPPEDPAAEGSPSAVAADGSTAGQAEGSPA